jgi:hypothetical protein
MEQLAPRALEPDITKDHARRVAEKTLELSLKSPARYAGQCGELGQVPFAPHVRAHCIERAADAARLHKCGRGNCGQCGHREVEYRPWRSIAMKNVTPGTAVSQIG